MCPHMYLQPKLPTYYGGQSEIYTPGAAFSNSFMISSRTSEDLGEEFPLLALSFSLRGPEWKVVSSISHQDNLENQGLVCEVREMTTHPWDTSWAPVPEADEDLAKPSLAKFL